MWYRVGSANEHPGITGVSHWLEHMLFQGSRQYPKGAMDRVILELGGTSNAFTDNDFTAYLTTVPKAHIEAPLRIEADRMTGAFLAPREAERERRVIQSEREGNENRPEYRVEQELHALAFRRHPYRWDPLGYSEDMDTMSRRELVAYYRKFYGPRNACLIVAGSFEPARIRRSIERLFGSLPIRGADSVVRDREPLPVAPRTAELVGPGSTPIVRMAWPAPPLQDPRAPAAMMLDQLLGGDTSLFAPQPFWWRSAEHPNSRLYRRLVDPGLAVRTSSDYRPRRYPGLFTVAAQASPGASLEKITEGIVGELAKLRRRAPSERELRDARDTIARGARLAYEGSARTAFRLGFFAAHGSLALESRLLRWLLKIRPEAIRAEAERLFEERRTVTVRYNPEAGPGAA